MKLNEYIMRKLTREEENGLLWLQETEGKFDRYEVNLR